MDLSIVVPVANEAENTVSLWREVFSSLTQAGIDFEVIFVDDGSTDGSAERLIALNAGDRLRVVQHRLNFGQSAAIATGFRCARGALVATLDGDGQNDPADLPVMIAQLRSSGADCITGVRTARQDVWSRRISSRLANRFRRAITGDRFSDSACGIRVMRREALTDLPVFNGLHRFIPALLHAQGFRVDEFSVRHRPRQAGTAKYGIHNRLWRGIRDCFGVRWLIRRTVPSVRLKEAVRE